MPVARYASKKASPHQPLSSNHVSVSAVVIARIGGVAGDRAQARVQIALGPAREPREGTAVRGARLGDRDRVERLEQRHDVPDRGQRIAVAVVQARVIPAAPSVSPLALGRGHAGLGQQEVVPLRRGERRSGWPGRGRCGGERAGGEQNREDRREEAKDERAHEGHNPTRPASARWGHRVSARGGAWTGWGEPTSPRLRRLACRRRSPQPRALRERFWVACGGRRGR